MTEPLRHDLTCSPARSIAQLVHEHPAGRRRRRTASLNAFLISGRWSARIPIDRPFPPGCCALALAELKDAITLPPQSSPPGPGDPGGPVDSMVGGTTAFDRLTALEDCLATEGLECSELVGSVTVSDFES